jgi:hypothetical protein
MLSRTRLKIIGAGLSAVLLFGGHSVLPAHADSPLGDATLVTSAETSDALDMAADAQTWTDPNITCGPNVAGQAITNGVDEGVAQVSAEEEAVGDVTCFSFTHQNYTLNANLSIQDADGSGGWTTVCTYPLVSASVATDGAATVRIVLACFDRVGVPIQLHVHRAHLTWTTTLGTSGKADSPTWTIFY